MANKTKKRVKLVENIANILKNPEIYDTINWKRLNESGIKQFMYSYIVREVANQYLIEKKCKPLKAEKEARNIVLWEGNKQTTISNISFMGTGNRPDFVIDFPGTSIAIEIKKGSNGQTIREGLGQSISVSKHFDFVICLLIVPSKDKEIL